MLFSVFLVVLGLLDVAYDARALSDTCTLVKSWYYDVGVRIIPIVVMHGLYYIISRHVVNLNNGSPRSARGSSAPGVTPRQARSENYPSHDGIIGNNVPLRLSIGVWFFTVVLISVPISEDHIQFHHPSSSYSVSVHAITAIFMINHSFLPLKWSVLLIFFQVSSSAVVFFFFHAADHIYRMDEISISWFVLLILTICCVLIRRSMNLNLAALHEERRQAERDLRVTKKMIKMAIPFMPLDYRSRDIVSPEKYIKFHDNVLVVCGWSC